MALFAMMRRAVARSELMQAMFTRLGIIDWFGDNPARAAVMRRAAMRCAACGHERECVAWLDSHATAEHAPGFCRNKDLVERVRASIEAHGT